MLNAESTKIWQTYLTSINEAKEITYIDPPPRAKFQKGDVVVIRDDGRFAQYQTKKQLPYVNRVGVVVGYKNIPGAYSKFALQFSDGAIHLIHGHFIYGPFADLATAKKYEDTSVEFDSKDIKGAKAEWETKPNFELKIKEILTQAPFNFTWFDSPQINKKTKGKTFLFTLASRGPFELLRANIAMTKKLTTAEFNTGGFSKGYALSIPADYINSLIDAYCTTNLLVNLPPEVDESVLVTYYRESVNELIQNKAHFAKLFDIYDNFIRVGRVNDEIFLKIADTNIAGNPSGGYTYTIPQTNNSFSNPAFAYNPLACTQIDIFDRLTIVGDAKIRSSSYFAPLQDLTRSPKTVNGNLEIQSTCSDFTGGPLVNGHVKGCELDIDERYKDYTRRQGLKDTVSSIFSDNENIIDW